MTTTEEKTENREVLKQETENLKKENETQKKEKKSRPGLKLLLITGICLVFLIPQLLLRNLVSERQSTENNAEMEVFEKWGGHQTVVGPFFEINYTEEGSTDTKTWLIMPETLDVNGNVNSKALKRGIYDFTVYETSLELKGQFTLPNGFDKIMRTKECHFEEAHVIIGLTNLRGLRDNVTMKIGNTNYGMKAASGYWSSSLMCCVDLSSLVEGETVDFSVTLPFKGSGSLMFAPVGQTTVVNLNSDCVTPSFNGAYLPDEREVNDKGFKASWKVLALNREYPQVMMRDNCTRIKDTTFGVELKVPVEQYQQTDRSIKYAFLIILLTFAAVFFVEMRKSAPVHPVQYLLIGIALIVFYTLLLSFSEHMNFLLSYLIASVMTITLIVVFMTSVTKDKKTGLGIGVLLAVLYAFVYVLLQLVNYALLVGSVGVFFILGIAMFATQKIDWYKKKD